MTHPLVSVIIPCYNHGKYIEEAIASVEQSSEPRTEIIIVNDGSDEELTLNKLNELGKSGYRVIHQKNMGVSKARNRAITESSGKYILPLDADNKITQFFIQKAARILEENPEFSVVYSDKIIIRNNTEYVIKVGGFDFPRLLRRNYIDTCAVFRKTLWEQTGGYDEKIMGLEDYDFWLSAAKRGFKFCYLPEPLFFYRILENSMSRSRAGSLVYKEIRTYIHQKHSDQFTPEMLKMIRLAKEAENNNKYLLRSSVKYLYRWAISLFGMSRKNTY